MSELIKCQSTRNTNKSHIPCIIMLISLSMTLVLLLISICTVYRRINCHCPEQYGKSLIILKINSIDA